MCTARLVAASLLAVAAARAEVIVIDPQGAPGAPLLADALLHSDAGDVLLLKAGNYNFVGTPFEIRRGITLMPAPDAGRIALQFVEVTNLPAAETLVLRDLDIGDPGWVGGPAALHVSLSDGEVWLEDCELRGSAPLHTFFPLGGGTGARACWVEFATVVFRGCTLAGGPGANADQPGSFAGSGGVALVLEDDSVATLHGCTLIGGDAGQGLPGGPSQGNGGDALTVYLSDVSLSGCTLIGGAEGADNDAAPGVSGSAIESSTAFNDVRVVECLLTAGEVQGLGTQGPAIEDEAHKVVLIAEPARSLVLPDQLREGESGTLLLDGAPGDLAMVLLSAQVKLIPLKGQDGTLVTELATLQGPLVIAVLAGPDGELSLPFTLPDLPAGLEAVTVFVQGLFKDAGGTSLGGVSAMTWIDAAF